jgi:hypothetical protein
MISISESFGRLQTPFISVNPLRFNGFGAFSWIYSVFIHKLNNIPNLCSSPALHKFSIRKRLIDVKANEGFTGGAPLDGFNSKFKFLLGSFFKHKWVFIDYKSNVNYNNDIYNLSVEKDETYITELAIVHNCRCDTLQLMKEEAVITPKKSLPSVERIPEIFRNNPGKDNYIFSPKHPYFKVDERHEQLKNNNFNLPFKP